MRASVTTFMGKPKSFKILFRPVVGFPNDYVLKFYDTTGKTGDITFFFDSKDNVSNFMEEITKAFNNFMEEKK
ncbi:MAG: hypothetical protein NT145_00345 [Elusimicrobia bacterium]|nr:hypothetical protein [Elusimicrobiota bacterium]